jgi:structural maintenance of chromosome 1
VALSKNVCYTFPFSCDVLIEQPRISTTGASEYKLNKRTVTYTTYNEALIKHNILVKAKNFLVFQGDVEAVASQSPKELTRLIEQISGSLELAAEYERAKEGQDRATENATHNFTKRRAIAGEIKQYKEQKGEAERFEALCQERVRCKGLFLDQNQLSLCAGRPYSPPPPVQIVPH